MHLWERFLQSSERAYWYRQQQNGFLSSLSAVLGREKTQRRSSSVNTVLGAWWRFCFWPNTHTQPSVCDLMRYHDVKSIMCFSTILCVSKNTNTKTRQTFLSVENKLTMQNGWYFQRIWHRQKQKMPKSNILSSRNLKIMVIFLSHLLSGIRRAAVK